MILIFQPKFLENKKSSMLDASTNKFMLVARNLMRIQDQLFCLKTSWRLEYYIMIQVNQDFSNIDQQQSEICYLNRELPTISSQHREFSIFQNRDRQSVITSDWDIIQTKSNSLDFQHVFDLQESASWRNFGNNENRDGNSDYNQFIISYNPNRIESKLNPQPYQQVMYEFGSQNLFLDNKNIEDYNSDFKQSIYKDIIESKSNSQHFLPAFNLQESASQKNIQNRNMAQPHEEQPRNQQQPRNIKTYVNKNKNSTRFLKRSMKWWKKHQKINKKIIDLQLKYQYLHQNPLSLGRVVQLSHKVSKMSSFNYKSIFSFFWAIEEDEVREYFKQRTVLFLETMLSCPKQAQHYQAYLKAIKDIRNIQNLDMATGPSGRKISRRAD